MAGVTIELHGTGAAASAFRALGTRGPAALARAAFAEWERMMGESKLEVPVDTGTLRGTGHVEPPEETRAGVEVVAGYGGPAAPYAVIVHEDPTARHPVGKAKYLEDPATRASAGMEARLAARLRAELGR